MSVPPAIESRAHSVDTRQVSRWCLQIALFAITLLPFLPLWVDAGHRGMTSDDFSHVFIIPLMALGVFWTARKRVAPDTGWGTASIPFCGILWVLGAAALAVGYLLHEPLLAQAGFPLAMIGMSGTVFGTANARRHIFIFIFLLFSLGFFSELMLRLFSGWLRFVGAGLAHDWARTVFPGRGPYGLSGPFILTRIGLFDVAESCSGTRSMVTLFVLGSIMGWYQGLSPRRTMYFLVTLLLLATAGNLMRIVCTLLTALWINDMQHYDLIHEIWNWVALAAYVLILIPLVYRMASGARIRVTVTRVLVIVLMTVYILLVADRARESEMHWTQLAGQAGVQTPTLVLASPEIPARFQALVIPSRSPWYAWVALSGLVHTSTLHLLANMVMLFCLGEAARRNHRWWSSLVPLIAGQLAVSISGYALVGSTGQDAAFLGASGAVAGLLGYFAMDKSLGQGISPKVKATLLVLAFLLSLYTEKMFLEAPYRLHMTPHLAALAAGAAIRCISQLGTRLIRRSV